MTTERGVLVAGVGNVFLGDDGFGVAVARRLAQCTLPAGVVVADYGIRGMHLAYELLDGRFDTLIMVDAVPVDEPPGTVVVLEVDPRGDDSGADLPATPDAHGMDPAAVLRMLRMLGGTAPGVLDQVLVVGCRPAVVDERMELSEPVRAAVGEAARLVLDLAAHRRSNGRDGR
ncbi:hydrogenase maturation protease [Saccharomonospora sp. NPDC046836]|uniref:hydrogenase maturation protease n=1 Tax=Saccharomonospora sp. NPDC046836 TaxID=3156921 RepID=UPI0033DCEA93